MKCEMCVSWTYTEDVFLALLNCVELTVVNTDQVTSGVSYLHVFKKETLKKLIISVSTISPSRPLISLGWNLSEWPKFSIIWYLAHESICVWNIQESYWWIVRSVEKCFQWSNTRINAIGKSVYSAQQDRTFPAYTFGVDMEWNGGSEHNYNIDTKTLMIYVVRSGYLWFNHPVK